MQTSIQKSTGLNTSNHYQKINKIPILITYAHYQVHSPALIHAQRVIHAQQGIHSLNQGDQGYQTLSQ